MARRCHRRGVPTAEESLPFRWDLITPDQLGSLLSGTTPPDLWFLNDLLACTGKVLARSGNGDLVFVGRSLDSMSDLLGGALADRTDARQLRRLPLSFQRPGVGSRRRWWRRPLTAAEQAQDTVRRSDQPDEDQPEHLPLAAAGDLDTPASGSRDGQRVTAPLGLVVFRRSPDQADPLLPR
jgi:hypothetical protein